MRLAQGSTRRGGSTRDLQSLGKAEWIGRYKAARVMYVAKNVIVAECVLGILDYKNIVR